MALGKFVVTANVTVARGTVTGGSFGSASTAGSSWSELWPVTFQRGQVVVADSSAGTTPAQLLYQAIGSANLRAFVPGQDDGGRDGLPN